MSIPARVVLASGDLQAHARVLAAAEPTGSDVEIAPPNSFADRLAGAALLIVDLDGGRDAALDEVRGAAAAGVLPRVVVGFVSHVDGRLARAARDAGVRPIARGRFWAALPELLRDPASSGPSSRSGGRDDPRAEPHGP